MSAGIRTFDGVTYGGGYFHAHTFGAAGDGSADDTAALQAALDEAGTTGTGARSGGEVVLPRGVFKITSTLTIPNAVSLRGHGCGVLGDYAGATWIDASGVPAGDPAILIDGAHARDITLEGFYLTGRAAGNESEIQVVNHATHLTLRDLVVVRGSRSGVCVDLAAVAGDSGSSSVVQSILDNVRTGGGAYGFKLGASCTSISLRSCYANGHAVCGFEIGGTYISLLSCASDTNLYGYVVLRGTSVGLYACGAEGSRRSAIRLMASRGVTLASCRGFMGGDQAPLPVIATVAGAGGVTAGAHRYKVVYATSGGETLMSLASNEVTTTGTGDTVSITSIPIGAAGVYRRLYRTKAGETIYRALASIADDTTTTYDDTLTDLELGAPMLVATIAGGAGNITVGTHIYRVSFTDADGVEGHMSDPSDVVTIASSANARVTLTIPVGMPGTTARNVYRSRAGTTTPMYLVATVSDNSTTTYYDNAADAAITSPGSVWPTFLDIESSGGVTSDRITLVDCTDDYACYGVASVSSTTSDTPTQLAAINTSLQLGMSTAVAAAAVQVAGDVALPGALAVAGVTTLTGALNANGGIAVDATNFTVSGTTGAVHTAGALDVATDKFTVDTSGNTAAKGTLAVTGATTLTGVLNANGGIACDTNKFTVADGTGDTVVAGTLTASGVAGVKHATQSTVGLTVGGCGATSSTYALNCINTTPADTFWVNDAGAVYIKDNCSALSFTDRTPWYDGDALADVRRMTGTAKDGVDHRSLPAFARRTIPSDVSDGHKQGTTEGRDLGAMISILTVAIQQLDARLAEIERMKEKP